MYKQEYIVKNEKYHEIYKCMREYDYEKAISLLEDFMIEYPFDKYAIYDYGVCLMKIRKQQESIQVLDALRKKKPKKILYKVYTTLIDLYNISKEREKIEELIEESNKDFEPFERDLIKTKGYYNLGLGIKAAEIIKEIKPTNEAEKAKLNILVYQYANNMYYKLHQKEIEKNMKDYLRKTYISYGTARNIYLKFYLACSNYEEAYKYININKDSSLESLLTSYEICQKLNKKEECQKCLYIMNTMSQSKYLSELSVSNAKLLYLNGKTEEAYEMCKTLSTYNMDAALLVYSYSIKLGKTNEAIDLLKNILNSKAMISNKMIGVLRSIIDLYIYNQRYNEAYDLYKEYSEYLKSTTRKEYDLFLSKKLVLEPEYKNCLKTYTLNQIENYSYEEAVKHIAKHKYEKKEKLVHTVFSENIEIEDLLEKIKPYLTKENLYEVGIYNKYEIDCTNLDINENRLTVGVLTETNNIVFCFPTKQLEDEIDNYLEETSSNKKISVKTGLERFNQKYKKFVMNK